jgi:hypothetical protein
MYWFKPLGHCAALVIVSDFDVVSIAFLPDKANSPLIVDANAVLAPSVAT